MGKALNASEKQAERQSVRLAFYLCVIVIAHCLFFATDWYLTHYSLDMAMHFAAGAWTAAFGAYFFFSFGRLRASYGVWEALALIGFVALVGVLWEFHEYVFDLFITDPARIMQTSVADTMSDLFFDLLGATMAVTARYARFPWNNHS